MGGLSLWHWLVVIILVMLLFGRGRISDLMGDLGKGMKSFKEGMADENEKARTGEPRQLPREQQPIDITPSAPPPAEPTTPSVPPASGDEPRG